MFKRFFLLFEDNHFSEKGRPFLKPVIFGVLFLTSFAIGGGAIVNGFTYTTNFASTTEFFNDPFWQSWKFYIFAAIAIHGLFRLYFSFLDYRIQIKIGTKISVNYFWWLLTSYALTGICMGVFTLLLSGTVHLITGYGLEDVMAFTTANAGTLKTAYFSIPNLVNLPAYIAAPIVFLGWSLVGYSTHYLGHVSRLYWLISHRAHHVTTALTNASTFPAEFGFPIFWLLGLLQFVVVIGLSRMLTTESLAWYFGGYYAIYQFTEALNHSGSLYKISQKNKFYVFLCKLCSCGPYHMLHHSSLPEYSMVNLGGNTALWDFVFGTYAELPKVDELQYGLTNQPLLDLSARAMVFGGYQRIAYELKHNKDFKTRLKILFGSVYYAPPITKDFLVLDKNSTGQVMHKIQTIPKGKGSFVL